MKMHRIDIREIPGFIIGNAENTEGGTGCTVIISEQGAVGGVDVRGGAPATRETDLLRSENTVENINAVVLSGGSAFGLEAASGVMCRLAEKGVGFKVGDISVPIVCGASLFDLAVGDPAAYPDKQMGTEACDNAYAGVFESGNHGAGTGATCGKILGMERAMKTGLGTYACSDGYIQVGAVTAVNACADVYNGAGNIIAGLRNMDGDKIVGSIKYLKGMVHSQSDPDLKLEDIREMAAREGAAMHTEETPEDVAEALQHAYEETSPDVYTEPDEKSEDICLQEESDAPEEEYEISYVDSPEEPEEDTEPEEDEEPEEMPEVELSPEDMGYDIPFNTTISCLITNAKLTKSQANKLASILHDAYARSIKPVHSTMDGDTIFVMCSGETEVNFDAFAALATDILQYAIIDAANTAESAYGLPAARDIIRK